MTPSRAQPEVVIHEMTALAGKPDMRRWDRWVHTTNELRTRGVLGCVAPAGVRLERVADVAAAVCALTNRGPTVVIAGARWAQPLTAAVRGQRGLASAHIVVGAALDSPRELREVLDVGVDDVMRVPFQPEVLAARLAGGRLRADEMRLRSLVANIPGALYRVILTGRWSG